MVDRTSNDFLISSYEAQRSMRRTVEGTWDVIERFIVPYRGKMFKEYTNEREVQWRRREVYDGTAPESAQTLAASMHAYLTSPAFQWFQIMFRDDELNENKEAADWIYKQSLKCYQALQDSNFNLEVTETYLDLVSFGTSIIFEEERKDKNKDWDGLDFSAVNCREAFFEEDYRKGIIRLYRRLTWTALQMATKFGTDALPKQIRDRLDSPGQAEMRHDVIFCVYERNLDQEMDTTQIIADEAKRPFGYKYILHSDRTTLKEGGYYEMPAFVPRWRQATGSQWGYSPSMLALSDVLTLNQLVELILKSAEKVIDPANLVREKGLMSDLDLRPAGRTLVKDPERDVVPYESRARFDVSELQRDRLQTQIRGYYHVDQLELKESPQMTATEVQVRYEMMQRLLGPTLGRLQSDFLDPLVERTFRILWRAGKLDPAPEVVQGKEIDIKYVGPLTRAQRLDDATATERWLGAVGQMGEAYPGMLDVPEPHAISRGLGEMYGVPPMFMRSKEEVEQISNSRNEAMQRQAQAEEAQALASAAKDGSAAVTNLSDVREAGG